jgi:hypothetical protein
VGVSLGNSSATGYRRRRMVMALIGPSAARRTSVKFGKPQAVAYDSKREQYLVPN